MSVLAVALLLVGTGQSKADLGARLGSASTEALAKEFLPREAAANVVRHRLEPLLPGSSGPPYSSITFYGRPTNRADGFCERARYYVASISSVRSVHPGTDLRLGDCPASTTGKEIFAHLQPGTPVAEAKRALRWLEWARAVARSGSAAPFQLSCSSETDVDRCAGGALKALAELPLDKTYIVGGGQHSWAFAITESEPGRMLWDVGVETTPGRSKINLTWKIPAPF